jgi:hypothetical protein
MSDTAATGMGGADGTEDANASIGSTGSYGLPGHAAPDPKQPVTSMGTEADEERTVGESSRVTPTQHDARSMSRTRDTDGRTAP